MLLYNRIQNNLILNKKKHLSWIAFLQERLRRYEFMKVQGDLAAAFYIYKKSLQLSTFHISLAAVALFKCQPPDKHVMEVNLRGGKVFVGSHAAADVGSSFCLLTLRPCPLCSCFDRERNKPGDVG